MYRYHENYCIHLFAKIYTSLQLSNESILSRVSGSGSCHYTPPKINNAPPKKKINPLNIFGVPCFQGPAKHLCMHDSSQAS